MNYLKVWHDFWRFHSWVKDTEDEHDGWDYSEPHERRGDYLPTKWKGFHCDCGAQKRVYFEGFTHFGVGSPRAFIKQRYQWEKTSL